MPGHYHFRLQRGPLTIAKPVKVHDVRHDLYRNADVFSDHVHEKLRWRGDHVGHSEKWLDDRRVPSEKVIGLAAPIVQDNAFAPNPADQHRRTDDHEEIKPGTRKD